MKKNMKGEGFWLGRNHVSSRSKVESSLFTLGWKGMCGHLSIRGVFDGTGYLFKHFSISHIIYRGRIL